MAALCLLSGESRRSFSLREEAPELLLLNMCPIIARGVMNSMSYFNGVSGTETWCMYFCFEWKRRLIQSSTSAMRPVETMTLECVRIGDGVYVNTKTYSQTSVTASMRLLSEIHMEQGGTHPPSISSSLTWAGDLISGTM